MKLPLPSGSYDRVAEQRRNGIIEQADARNHKRGQDVEIGEGRLILTSPDGTRFAIEVDNAGTITATSI